MMPSAVRAQQHAGRFRLWAEALLDLIYPPTCAHCGRVDARWCSRCAALLQAYPARAVPCQVGGVEAALAAGQHEGLLRDAVHSLKYDSNPVIAGLLAALLHPLIPWDTWHVDGIVPVPIHHNRQRKRGYNQSEVLADALSALAGAPTLTETLQRVRDTPAQVGLNSAERMANVLDAFRCTTSLQGRSLLLIDDVCTTGATLSACAATLRAAGAAALYAVCVSRA